MPFNTDNFNKAPWTNGIMELSHEECMEIINKCKDVVEKYTPENSWDNDTPDNIYIVSTYNKIDNWKKSINGDTYDCLLGYNPDVDKQGINEYGIIKEMLSEEGE